MCGNVEDRGGTMSLLESTVDPLLRRQRDREERYDGKRRRAAILLRVSSSGQVRTDYDPEGLSIPTQRKGCTQKAESLHADVVREYIEPGVSGGLWIKRKAFKKLLADIRELHDVDYVIIWSVSRWARDNEDYWTARSLVNRAGAALLAVKEPIGDDSAHGIMFESVMVGWAASQRIQIAEYVTDGLRRKVEVGGTTCRAPIGYVNVREPLPDGGEVRTVTVDRQRAEIICWGYRTYATGLYSIADITTLLEVRGLRSRATRRYTSKPLSQSAVHALLSNPYYAGKIKYHGKLYPGRHEPIISEDLFGRVQAILAAHKLAGERDRKHSHYLKGSVFCGACGGRLTYSQNTGNGGTFEYFVCLGNQRHKCSQRAQRVDAVEAAIENHYRTIVATETDRERVRAAVEQKLSEMTETSVQEIERCNALLADLKIQERKLMEKDYRDEISSELFSEESARIKRERLDATAVVDRLNVHHEEIQDALALVLSILSHDIHDLYLRATPTQRRFINQAIFKAIWVSHEDIEDSQLNTPFDEIRVVSEATRIVNLAIQGLPKARKGQAPDPKEEESGALALGSSTTLMVELVGLEPTTSTVPR
jgi:site-specific DNA recombinase